MDVDGDLYDLEFQRSFLGHFLRDSDFAKKTGDSLEAEFFSDELTQRVARIAIAYNDENGASPGTLIFRYLDGMREKSQISDAIFDTLNTYVDELFSVELQNRKFLLKEFNHFCRLRKAKSAMVPFAHHIKKNEWEEAEDLMKELFLFRPDRAHDLGGLYAVDPTERIYRRRQETRDRFWLLIPEIDRRIDGLLPGEVGVWQSQRSSAGKSAALQYITRSGVFQGKRVLVLSGEMSRESWEDRLDMCVVGLHTQRLTEGRTIEKRMREMHRHGGGIWIYDFPQFLTTMSELRKVKTMIENVHNFHADVVIIDTIDDIVPEKSDYNDSFAAGKELYSHFRGWARQEEFVGWTGLQSGRAAAEATEADQEHVQGSIAKAQIADLIISINRTKEEHERSMTRVFIAKNRDGHARFSLTFSSDFSRMQFRTSEDVADEQTANGQAANDF